MAIEDTTPVWHSLRADLPVYGKLAGIALLWWAAYSVLPPVTQWLAYGVLGLAHGPRGRIGGVLSRRRCPKSCSCSRA